MMNNLVQFKGDDAAAILEANILADATMRWLKDGGTPATASKILKDFESQHIKLSSASRLLSLSDGNAGANGQGGVVGKNTFQVLEGLIQDYSPTFDIALSPYNTMLPFRTVDSVTAQQDIFESNYGWAREGNQAGGIINEVPLLEATGRRFSGYMFTAISYIAGEALIALREMGSSDTRVRGLVQRVALQQILLMKQVIATIELTRAETLIKGSFLFKGDTISTPLLTPNIHYASDSLGTYSRATNTLTPSPTTTANFINEIARVATKVQGSGITIKEIIIPAPIYQAIFQSPVISASTVYMSAVSSNDAQGVRDNLFRLSNIPSLKNIDLVSDDRWIKFEQGETTTLNTRPLAYGKEVDTSSFRALFITEPNGLSVTGYMGMFPNIYARAGSGVSPVNATIETDYGNGVTMVTQDMSQFNWQNQQMQMFASSVIAPMVSLNNSIHVFDFRVNVVA